MSSNVARWWPVPIGVAFLIIASALKTPFILSDEGYLGRGLFIAAGLTMVAIGTRPGRRSVPLRALGAGISVAACLSRAATLLLNGGASGGSTLLVAITAWASFAYLLAVAMMATWPSAFDRDE